MDPRNRLGDVQPVWEPREATTSIAFEMGMVAILKYRFDDRLIKDLAAAHD
jgi:hypothetical protein